MSEEIKEFYNGPVGAGVTQAVVTNDATKKAFIKDIYVTGKDYPTEVDLVVGGNTIYSSVAVGVGETVKFQQENLIVPKNSAMEFINKALVYGSCWEYTATSGQVYSQHEYYDQTLVMPNGQTFVGFGNSASTQQPNFLVVNADGTLQQDVTTLFASTNSYGKFEVAYNLGTAIPPYIAWISMVGTTLTHGTLATSNWVAIVNKGTVASTLTFPTICGLGTGFMISYFKTASNDMEIRHYTSALSASVTNLNYNPGSTAGACTESCELSNGKAVLAWDEIAPVAASYFSIWEYGTAAPIVDKVALSADRIRSCKIRQMVGKFVAVYVKSTGNNNYTYMTIFNNDGTVAVAEQEINDDSQIDNSFQLTIRENDEICFWWDRDNKLQLKTYSALGVLLDTYTKIRDLSSSTYEQIASYPATGKTVMRYHENTVQVTELLVDILFNVKVDGVEVTDD